MESLITVIVWIFSAIVVGMLGRDRTIGFWKAFLISIFCSPIVGVVCAGFSPRIQRDQLEKALLEYLKDKRPQ